jgi:hypothetical protein
MMQIKATESGLPEIVTAARQKALNSAAVIQENSAS